MQPNTNSFITMKKIGIAAIALTVLTACNDKIGFVDNTKLLNDYKEKQDIEAALKIQINAFEKKRDSIEFAFNEEIKKFQAQTNNLSPEQAKRKYNELQQKQNILGQHLQQQQEQIRLESQNQMDSLLVKVKRNIEAYGKEKGYTFILGANSGGSVLYGNESKEITKELTEYLNKKYTEKK